MKKLLAIIVILAVAVGGVGYSQGWFSYTKDKGLSVDAGKMKQDTKRAKDAVAKGVKKGVAKTKQVANAAMKKAKKFSVAAAGKGKEWAKIAAAKTKSAWSTLSSKARGAYDSLKGKVGAGETAFVGSVQTIDKEASTITIKMADGEIVTYPIAKEADIQLNSGIAAFAKLSTGDEAAISVGSSGEVVRVYAAR